MTENGPKRSVQAGELQIGRDATFPQSAMQAPPLARYDAARRALAEAHRVGEVKSIRDKAVAMQAYAKQAKDTTLITQAIEIRMRAERRAGEMLIEMAEHKERHDGKGQSREVLRSQRATVSVPKLTDLGINKTQSSRWQALASLDSETFEAQIEQASKSAYNSVARRFIKEQEIKRAKEQRAKIIEHGCVVDDLIKADRRFGVIYADPPWPFETSQTRRSVEHHYNTSTLDEIMKLPVAQLAADDCALVMWCTWPHIAIGTHCKIIEAWNFKPSTVAFVWVKQKPGGNGLRHSGNGYWTIANTEACLIATKGSPLRLANDVHQVVMAPVREHSGKPEEVRCRIERLFRGPYLELYGRKLVPGWTVWGNEIPHGEFRESLVTSCNHHRAEDSGTHVAQVPGDDLSIPEFLRRLPPEAAQ